MDRALTITMTTTSGHTDSPQHLGCTSDSIGHTKRAHIHSFTAFGRRLHYCPHSNSLFTEDDASPRVLEQWIQDNAAAPATVPGPQSVNRGHALRGIQSLELVITRRCNLACDYCFFYHAWGSQDLPVAPMPAELARNAAGMVVPALEAGRSCRVAFMGGEPLMDFDLVLQVMDYLTPIYRRAGCTHRLYFLSTNGYSLTDTVLQKLTGQPVTIQISLDGPACCHDAHRRTAAGGRPSHAVVERAARQLLAHGHGMHVNAVWRPGCCSLLQRVRYFESLGATSLTLAPSSTEGINAPGYLQAEDYEQFLQELEAYIPHLIQTYRRGRRPLFDPFNTIMRLFHNPKDIPKACDPIGSGNCAVATDGRIYPCTAFIGRADSEIGSVARGLDADLMNQFDRRRAKHRERCASCWAWPLCAGYRLCEMMNDADRRRQQIDLLCDFNRRRVELALGFCATSRSNVTRGGPGHGS